MALIRDKTLKVAVPRLAYLTQHAKDEALQLEAALALTKLAVERGPVQQRSQAQQTNVHVNEFRVLQPGDPAITRDTIRV